MPFQEKVKELLDVSGVTEPSKLYTPFTLFCILFAIYFNADTLGTIFLQDDWTKIEPKLTTLVKRDIFDWASFIFKVFSYSLGLTILYGVFQVLSASIWGASNNMNIWVSRLLNKHSYVNRELYEEALKKTEQTQGDMFDLHKRLDEYKGYAPEDHKELIEHKKEIERTFTKATDEIKSIRGDLKNKETHIGGLEINIQSKSSKVLTLTAQNNYLNGFAHFHSSIASGSLDKFTKSGNEKTTVNALAAHFGINGIIADLVHNKGNYTISVQDELTELHGTACAALMYLNLGVGPTRLDPSMSSITINTAHIDELASYI